MINFVSTWNNLLKHCISADFLLMEGYVQGALQGALKQSVWEGLTDKSYHYLEKFT